MSLSGSKTHPLRDADVGREANKRIVFRLASDERTPWSIQPRVRQRANEASGSKSGGFRSREGKTFPAACRRRGWTRSD